MERSRTLPPVLAAVAIAIAAPLAAQQQPAQPRPPPSARPAPSQPAAQAQAQAQPPTQERLVSVAIVNVVEDISRNISVDSSQVPLNLQVPMDVAATVCNVAAGVLARQAESGIAQCTAQRTSPALDEWVLRQVRGNAQR